MFFSEFSRHHAINGHIPYLINAHVCLPLTVSCPGGQEPPHHPHLARAAPGQQLVGDSSAETFVFLMVLKAHVLQGKNRRDLLKLLIFVSIASPRKREDEMFRITGIRRHVIHHLQSARTHCAGCVVLRSSREQESAALPPESLMIPDSV